MTETKEIKMPPKKLLTVLFYQNGVVWMLAALIGFCVFIILGFVVDYRFFVLSLIWIFLLIPLVVAFLYFYYGMDPLTTFNSMPHTLSFGGNEVKVKLIPLNETEEGAKETIKEYTVDINDFQGIKNGADYVLLLFGKKGWVWLPVIGFDNIEDFKATVEFFTEKENGK